MADVLVVGAGPVGLVLAAGLRRHGVRVRIVDGRTEPLSFCRAIGVTPRTLEVYEEMGVAMDMINAGLWLEGVRVDLGGAVSRTQSVDLSDLPYASLGLPQPETERILTRHLSRLGVEIERGVTFLSLQQDGNRVRVQLVGADGSMETADFAYVAGCDGAHSDVRRAIGVGFSGEALPYPFMLGDVKAQWPADAGLPRGYALRALRVRENAPPDMFIAIPLPQPDRYRVSMLAGPEAAGPATDAVEHGLQSSQTGPTLADLQAVADRVMARPPVLSDMRWSSLFRISMRLADSYRVGRVFIAGDAAHIHPPTGGQGMNTGIQDAFNLAWKLGLVIAGQATPALLDSYEAERRPVAQDVIKRTTEESLSLGRPRQPVDRLADTQILVSYRGGAGFHDHLAAARDARELAPLAGDRAPDAHGLVRSGVGFPLRLFDLMRGAGFRLVVATDGAAASLAELEQRAATLGAAGFPVSVIAVQLAPDEARSTPAQPCHMAVARDAAGSFARAWRARPGDAFLVRPDGYLAWTARPFDMDSLVAALRNVFVAQ